jgi:hypothetical protein
MKLPRARHIKNIKSAMFLCYATSSTLHEAYNTKRYVQVESLDLRFTVENISMFYKIK